MNDTTQTLVRSVVKIGAGMLISKGLLDANGAEEFGAIILALMGVLWGIYHRTPSDGSYQTGTNVPIQQATGFDLERIETQGSEFSKFKAQMANIERRDDARPEGRAPGRDGIPSVGPTGRPIANSQ